MALFASFMRIHPQYRHDDIMRLPWRVFIAYLSEATRRLKSSKEEAFFSDFELGLEEWREHGHEWLENQRPRG